MDFETLIQMLLGQQAQKAVTSPSQLQAPPVGDEITAPAPTTPTGYISGRTPDPRVDFLAGGVRPNANPAGAGMPANLPGPGGPQDPFSPPVGDILNIPAPTQNNIAAQFANQVPMPPWWLASAAERPDPNAASGPHVTYLGPERTGPRTASLSPQELDAAISAQFAPPPPQIQAPAPSPAPIQALRPAAPRMAASAPRPAPAPASGTGQPSPAGGPLRASAPSNVIRMPAPAAPQAPVQAPTPVQAPLVAQPPVPFDQALRGAPQALAFLEQQPRMPMPAPAPVAAPAPGPLAAAAPAKPTPVKPPAPAPTQVPKPGQQLPEHLKDQLLQEAIRITGEKRAQALAAAGQR